MTVDAGAVRDAVCAQHPQVPRALAQLRRVPQHRQRVARERGRPAGLEHADDRRARLGQPGRDRQQERSRPRDDDPLPHHDPVPLEQRLRRAGGVHAGQRPARERQLAVVRAGGEDDRPRPDVAAPIAVQRVDDEAAGLARHVPHVDAGEVDERARRDRGPGGLAQADEGRASRGAGRRRRRRGAASTARRGAARRRAARPSRRPRPPRRPRQGPPARPRSPRRRTAPPGPRRSRTSRRRPPRRHRPVPAAAPVTPVVGPTPDAGISDGPVVMPRPVLGRDDVAGRRLDEARPLVGRAVDRGQAVEAHADAAEHAARPVAGAGPPPRPDPGRDQRGGDALPGLDRDRLAVELDRERRARCPPSRGDPGGERRLVEPVRAERGEVEVGRAGRSRAGPAARPSRRPARCPRPRGRTRGRAPARAGPRR